MSSEQFSSEGWKRRRSNVARFVVRVMGDRPWHWEPSYEAMRLIEKTLKKFLAENESGVPEDKALKLAALLKRRDDDLDGLKKDAAIVKRIAAFSLILTAMTFFYLWGR